MSENELFVIGSVESHYVLNRTELQWGFVSLEVHILVPILKRRDPGIVESKTTADKVATQFIHAHLF